MAERGREEERLPWVNTRFSKGIESVQADAVHDMQPNSLDQSIKSEQG